MDLNGQETSWFWRIYIRNNARHDPSDDEAMIVNVEFDQREMNEKHCFAFLLRLIYSSSEAKLAASVAQSVGHSFSFDN